MKKLEQIRVVVGRNPKAYPATKQLVDDGVYDLGTLNEAMQNDLFTFGGEEFEPINPFKGKKLSGVSSIDLAGIYLKEQMAIDAAKAIGKKAIADPGINSCRKCIDFIQSHGRNSEPSKTLVNQLSVSYAPIHPNH